jgi:hypothetical protein
MKTPSTRLTFTLDAQAADALAQFLKRLTYGDYRAQAVNEQDAYAMQQAGEAMRGALADVGIRPR